MDDLDMTLFKTRGHSARYSTPLPTALRVESYVSVMTTIRSR